MKIIISKFVLNVLEIYFKQFVEIPSNDENNDLNYLSFLNNCTPLTLKYSM